MTILPVPVCWLTRFLAVGYTSKAITSLSYILAAVHFLCFMTVYVISSFKNKLPSHIALFYL